MIHQLGGQLVPVMAIGCAFLFFSIWVIAAIIESIYTNNCNSRLKEKLVERGYSADEICRIVKAGSSEGDDAGFVEPSPPVKAQKQYQASHHVY